MRAAATWALTPAIFVAGLLVAVTSVPATDVTLPELVKVEPGTTQYRMSGEFLRNGFPVDAPLVNVEFSKSIHIMKHQVSSMSYAACVTDGVCAQPFKGRKPVKGQPATGISFIDAQKYTGWLSAKTGISWRLPRDDEWTYVAGSRFVDDAIGAGANPADPSVRSRLKYLQSADRGGDLDRTVKERGHYGANENGIFDLAGNVWEWTSTCYSRSKVLESGEIVAPKNPNCGVRVVEGSHRAYMTFFIQDAKSGGCSVGAPPDHLGFRLVRDDLPLFSIKRIRNWLKKLSTR